LSQNKPTKHQKMSKQSLNPHHHEKDDGAGDSPGSQTGTAQL